MSVLPFSKLNAQFIEPEIYKVELEINEQAFAVGYIEIQLRNNEATKVLSGYEFTLPIRSPYNISTKIHNSDVRFETQDSGGFTVLKTYFGADAIQPGTAKTLRINFFANNVLDTKSDVKQLYLPKPFSIGSVRNIKYNVTFPSSFGNPIFVDLSKVNIIDLTPTKKRFETNSSEGLLVVWGSSYHFDVEAKFKLKNDSDAIKRILFNIIPNLSYQSVDYRDVLGADYGVFDSYGNDFAFTEIPPKSEKEVGFAARIAISNEIHTANYPDNYSLPFDYDSLFGKQVLAQTSTQANQYSKMKILNDFLVSNIKPSKDERVSVDLLKDIWKRYETNGNLNSFELCSIAISFAESMGLKARLNYGYILLPDIAELDIRKPHVWCDFFTEDKSVMMDPLLESLTGVKYFDKLPNDRIYIGTWHQDQTYNNVLGLIGTSDDIIRLNFISLEGQVDTEEKGLTVTPNFPKNAYSGEFYNATISVENKSSKVYRIIDINLNDYPELGKITYNNSLTKSILPNQVSNIELNYLREPDFLFTGNKDIEISLLLDEYKDGYVLANTSLFLKPDEKVLIGLFGLTAFLVALCLLIIKKKGKFSKKGLKIKQW